MDNKAFIQSILPGALAAQKKYGVLASLTLAQAILESAWGKSSIGNNLFGIKAGSTWKGKTQTVNTTEYYNGVKTAVKATFRDYDTVEASIEDHAKLLTSARYKPVLNAADYVEACRQVQQCGYATDPNYTKKLIDIINANKLNQWDMPLELRDLCRYTSSPDLWLKAMDSAGPSDTLRLLPDLLRKARKFYKG